MPGVQSATRFTCPRRWKPKIDVCSRKSFFKPFLTLPQVRRVLFVGCDRYTKHFGPSFFNKHDYWTIDASENAAKFGCKHHIVDSVERLDQHFPEAGFDLIFLNGVTRGW